MMKIKKFESYEMDIDGDDIGTEHAKEIISKYIDDYDKGKTLQDSFDFLCSELEQELREHVMFDIKNVLSYLNSSFKKLDVSDEHYVKKNAKKYNL